MSVVEFTIAEGMQVLGGKTLLRLVVENRLNNAWTYTVEGKVARIEICSEVMGSHEVIFESVNGTGFDMTYSDKWFGPFPEDARIRAFMKETFVDILDSRRCHLIEFGGEDDHVHLLLEIHPALDISQLVNNLKSASSRRVRGQCKDHIATFYWKPLFWNRAYHIGSIGSVSLETVRRYVQQQGTKEKETKVTKATTKPSP